MKLRSFLRHHILILEKSYDSILDDNNNWHSKYATYASITNIYDCNLRYIDHKNFFDLLEANYYIFEIRFVQALNNKMRIKFDNRIFSIKKIIRDYKYKNFMKMIALEV